jgi:hypothetical protein
VAASTTSVPCLPGPSRASRLRTITPTSHDRRHLPGRRSSLYPVLPGHQGNEAACSCQLTPRNQRHEALEAASGPRGATARPAPGHRRTRSNPPVIAFPTCGAAPGVAAPVPGRAGRMAPAAARTDVTAVPGRRPSPRRPAGPAPPPSSTQLRPHGRRGTGEPLRPPPADLVTATAKPAQYACHHASRADQPVLHGSTRLCRKRCDRT